MELHGYTFSDTSAALGNYYLDIYSALRWRNRHAQCTLLQDFLVHFLNLLSLFSAKQYTVLPSFIASNMPDMRSSIPILNRYSGSGSYSTPKAEEPSIGTKVASSNSKIP